MNENILSQIHDLSIAQGKIISQQTEGAKQSSMIQEQVANLGETARASVENRDGNSEKVETKLSIEDIKTVLNNIVSCKIDMIENQLKMVLASQASSSKKAFGTTVSTPADNSDTKIGTPSFQTPNTNIQTASLTPKASMSPAVNGDEVWVECLDDTSGKTFWYHLETNQTSYTCPYKSE